ncbi:hypothetical protein Tco_0356274 [Tanacetum coccineum]
MSEPMPTIPTQSPFTYPIPNSSASPSFTQDDTFMPEPIQPMPTFTQPAVHTQTNPTGQQYPNNVQSQQFQQFQTATISANNAKFPLSKKEKLLDIVWGGNEESKKMKKTMLKQQFAEFSVTEEEGLHKGYDRFQKILSQLNQVQARPSTMIHQPEFYPKSPSFFLSQSCFVAIKTRGGLESMSFDDLYNKLRQDQDKIYEDFDQVVQLNGRNGLKLANIYAPPLRINMECNVKTVDDKARYSAFKVTEVKTDEPKALVSVDSMVNWSDHAAENKTDEVAKVYGMMAGLHADNSGKLIFLILLMICYDVTSTSDSSRPMHPCDNQQLSSAGSLNDQFRLGLLNPLLLKDHFTYHHSDIIRIWSNIYDTYDKGTDRGTAVKIPHQHLLWNVNPVPPKRVKRQFHPQSQSLVSLRLLQDATLVHQSAIMETVPLPVGKTSNSDKIDLLNKQAGCHRHKMNVFTQPKDYEDPLLPKAVYTEWLKLCMDFHQRPSEPCHAVHRHQVLRSTGPSQLDAVKKSFKWIGQLSGQRLISNRQCQKADYCGSLLHPTEALKRNGCCSHKHASFGSGSLRIQEPVAEDYRGFESVLFWVYSLLFFSLLLHYLVFLHCVDTLWVLLDFISSDRTDVMRSFILHWVSTVELTLFCLCCLDCGTIHIFSLQDYPNQLGNNVYLLPENRLLLVNVDINSVPDRLVSADILYDSVFLLVFELSTCLAMRNAADEEKLFLPHLAVHGISCCGTHPVGSTPASVYPYQGVCEDWIELMWKTRVGKPQRKSWGGSNLTYCLYAQDKRKRDCGLSEIRIDLERIYHGIGAFRSPWVTSSYFSPDSLRSNRDYYTPDLSAVYKLLDRTDVHPHADIFENPMRSRLMGSADNESKASHARFGKCAGWSHYSYKSAGSGSGRRASVDPLARAKEIAAYLKEQRDNLLLHKSLLSVLLLPRNTTWLMILIPLLWIVVFILLFSTPKSGSAVPWILAGDPR